MPAGRDLRLRRIRLTALNIQTDRPGPRLIVVLPLNWHVPILHVRANPPVDSGRLIDIKAVHQGPADGHQTPPVADHPSQHNRFRHSIQLGVIHSRSLPHLNGLPMKLRKEKALKTGPLVTYSRRSGTGGHQDSKWSSDPGSNSIHESLGQSVARSAPNLAPLKHGPPHRAPHGAHSWR